MTNNDRIKVRYLGPDDPLSLRTGKSYSARVLKLGWYGVVDETKEEYAYPPELFELLEEDDAKEENRPQNSDAVGEPEER